METIHTIAKETWHILLELSPWLLFGMLLAGILHVLLPSGFIQRHLGGSKWSSVFKAVVVGVPMPLCSCGVIPTAIGLRKDGASKGAATGFLISTPQTGVDSILVSATFLGWPFAIFKVISALLSGLIGGLVVNYVENGKTEKEVSKTATESNSCCSTSLSNSTSLAAPERCHPKGLAWKTKEALSFGLIQLLGDIYKWLIIGVLVAALISTFIPEGRLQNVTWTQGLLGMIVMLLISLPMYVCATASVPLAASLVAAGMSPGSALVLLMAGPTTNIATMGAIGRSFGKTVLAIYLATVIVMSISLGLLFDWLLLDIPSAKEHMHSIPHWFEVICAIGLLALLAYFIGMDIYRKIQPSKTPCCSD
jgi:uncharacterized protein